MAVIIKGASSPDSVIKAYLGAHGWTHEDILRFTQGKMDQGRPGDLIQRDMALDVATAGYLETKKDMSPYTKDGYAQDLKQFKAFMINQWKEKGITEGYVHNITKGDIERFLNSLKPRRKKGDGEVKASSKNRKLAVLKGVFDYLVYEGVLRKSPARLVKWAKEGTLPIMFLTRDQQELVLRTAAKNRENGLRDFNILFLALNCGLRLEEITKLSLHDLLLEKKQIVIHGKGDKVRNGILHKDMLEHINNYLRFVHYPSNKPEEDELGIPLFTNKKRKHGGQRITRNAIEKMVSKVFKSCGIEEGAIHRCRHSFAVNCLELEFNLVHIMYLLGHENVTTTVRYLRLSSELVLKQLQDHFPLAFVSLDNFADFISGKIGIEVKKSMEVVKKDDRNK